MLIRVGYDIQFELSAPVAMVAMLHVHPSRATQLLEPDELRVEPGVTVNSYTDTFGNRCSRFLAPVGHVRLWNSTLVQDPGAPEPPNYGARQHPVEELPPETLLFLLASRYCQVDQFSHTATDLFGGVPEGWQRVQAICDWVQAKVRFDYTSARPTKTALDVFTERVGVCRDFQHLAITFCRCLNIPARYATGYLGDIGVPATGIGDFSAWFEAYLGGRWWTFDARFNTPRIGRVLMATGRDAADVAMTTSFGFARLSYFNVVTDEVAG